VRDNVSINNGVYDDFVNLKICQIRSLEDACRSLFIWMNVYPYTMFCKKEHRADTQDEQTTYLYIAGGLKS
jgi:hypothetical protein